jgi:hypothetical protein
MGENELFEECEILEKDPRVNDLKDHTYLLYSTKVSDFKNTFEMLKYYAEDFKANPKIICNLVRKKGEKSYFEGIEKINIESDNEDFVEAICDGLK